MEGLGTDFSHEPDVTEGLVMPEGIPIEDFPSLGFTEEQLEDLLWQAYFEGFKQSRGVEETPPISERAARSRFDRFYDNTLSKQIDGGEL